MAYPSTITSFTNPLPTDKLNSPSHSSIETAQNTTLSEIQNYLGLAGNGSTIGTLIYQVQSPDSNGGGHIQTVNKGGTGLITYTKGDLLIASSASVLSKLAVGVDGQVLASDSSVATGIKWSNANTFSTKIATSASITTIGQSATANSDQSIFSVTIPGSVLLVDQAIRATVFVTQLQKNLSAASILLKANYGTNTVASILMKGAYTAGSVFGTLVCNLIANGSSVLQRGNIYADFLTTAAGISANNGLLLESASVLARAKGYVAGTSSVVTTANQTFGMTIRYEDSSDANELTINGYIVEKIA